MTDILVDRHIRWTLDIFVDTFDLFLVILTSFSYIITFLNLFLREKCPLICPVSTICPSTNISVTLNYISMRLENNKGTRCVFYRRRKHSIFLKSSVSKSTDLEVFPVQIHDFSLSPTNGNHIYFSPDFEKSLQMSKC